MSYIDYLTKDEYTELGFGEVADFDNLLKRAILAINIYTQDFYSWVDFETDFKTRKQLVKRAAAFQVAYLDSSGVMTAEDRQLLGSVTVGRTSVSYRGGNYQTSAGRSENEQYNLSIDTLNALRKAGFSYSGVYYDR